MDRDLRYTRHGRTPKSRTSNACEACKRRKTKCSGGPSPCEVCKRADTFCNFNPKLDTRRKLAYNSATIQDRQQFMLTALLQTIKHSREDDLQHLISLIRGPSRPDAVATCLRKQFSSLQSKGIIPLYDIDDTDVISFGLQGLCGHRKGRARPKSSPSATDQVSNQTHSPVAMSIDSQDLMNELDDEKTFENCTETRCSSPLSIGHDRLFDPMGAYNPNELPHAVHANLSQSQDFYSLRSVETLDSSLLPPGEHPDHSFQQTPDISQQRRRTRDSESSRSFAEHSSSVTTASSLADGADQHFCDPAQPYPIPASSSNYYLMQYYQALANSLPTTLNPNLALKVGHQSIFPQAGTVGNPATLPEDFSNSRYTFPPLCSKV